MLNLYVMCKETIFQHVTFTASAMLHAMHSSHQKTTEKKRTFFSKFLIAMISNICVLSCRCKFGQLGPGKCQFNSPHGFCLGAEQDIIVADTNNHRIQIFEKTGEFKSQFGIPGMV